MISRRKNKEQYLKAEGRAQFGHAYKILGSLNNPPSKVTVDRINKQLNDSLEELAMEIGVSKKRWDIIKEDLGFDILLREYLMPDYTDRENGNVQIVNDLKSVIGRIYKDNNMLYTLSPRKFEEIIAELLYYKGYSVELTGQTRDGGYDILALKTLDGFPLKFLVECKKYRKDNPVGIDIIRGFYHVVSEEKASKGIIVTTSYFSPDAKEKSKEGTLLDLRDNGHILDWVSDYIINPNTM